MTVGEGANDGRWEGIPRRLLELAFINLMAVGWVVAYLGARNDLSSGTPASRTFLLELYTTNDQIGLALALGLAATVLLVFRRFWPFATLVVVTALVASAELLFPLVTRNSAVPELTIAMAAFWAATRAAKPLLTVLPVAAVGLVVSTAPSYEINPRLDALSGISSGRLTAIGETLLAVLAACLAVGVGMVVQRLDRQSAEAEERNELLDARNAELEAARKQVAERAVEGERVRIARELHDVVAHHVTTMTVHAGAARQLAAGGSSEPVTDALQQIENSGRDAVNELHRLLGFLRGGEASPDRAPAPSLRQVDHLVANAPGGLAVGLAIEGDPAPLPTTVDLSAYRIIQEALTNTQKHAGATRADVQITYLPDAIDLVISDNGTAPQPSGNGSGLGLVGMRERAALHNGSLEVGPTDDGWMVTAHLRYNGNPRAGDNP